MDLKNWISSQNCQNKIMDEYKLNFKDELSEKLNWHQYWAKLVKVNSFFSRILKSRFLLLVEYCRIKVELVLTGTGHTNWIGEKLDVDFLHTGKMSKTLRSPFLYPKVLAKNVNHDKKRVFAEFGAEKKSARERRWDGTPNYPIHKLIWQ